MNKTEAAEKFLSTHEGVDWCDLVRIFEAGVNWGRRNPGKKKKIENCTCLSDKSWTTSDPKCPIHGEKW